MSTMQLTPQQIQSFQNTLFEYYDQHGRHDLPWRLRDTTGFDPYHIVVSELMLQQTQVSRVIPKYEAFLQRFPSIEVLASASLGDVLIAWQGLGYNRRAKFLWQAADQVVRVHDGMFPNTVDGLVGLPGIGKNTAGAVLAYTFNTPALFIETNVRTVYIHHFFADQEAVSDKEVLSVLKQTLMADRPRDFYWAVMDYGTFLKKEHGNAGARSKHYVRQSPFEGSRRQVRGKILRLLSARGYSASELALAVPDDRREAVLADLVQEGLISQTHSIYHLA